MTWSIEDGFMSFPVTSVLTQTICARISTVHRFKFLCWYLLPYPRDICYPFGDICHATSCYPRMSLIMLPHGNIHNTLQWYTLHLPMVISVTLSDRDICEICHTTTQWYPSWHSPSTVISIMPPQGDICHATPWYISLH